ncbi:MAG: penicillin-binding protein 2, partial [Propionibacteriaceae bacterium]|nr:penicillin-binding protein 2 [Propionibacteriaceae bacterium]
LFREQAPVRNYPNGTLAANVVGYMTYSDELEESGKYPWTGGGGLEQYLNAELSGVDGQEIFESSPYGRIPIGTSIVQEPTEGISYQLTLDLGLQYMQDQRLAAAVIKSGSASGMAITMSVSGEVLAMSSYPTFDPNDLSNATNEVLGNPIVMGPYEPGSVEKVLTLAALVDQGIITPKTHVIVPGSINSGDSTIYDAFRHDTLHLTAAGVLAQSSNIGTILMSRQMSKETFASYLAAFGLGSATGIGLPGEEEGWIPDGTMTDQTRDNIAFGQGLTVTALQEAAALAAIANKGVYVSPRIIKSATTADGRPIEIEAPEVRQVISPEASEMVMSMMEAVVEYNSNSFDIAGFRTGGKSGTAEVVNPKCGCYRGGGYVISYAGIAPIEDPQLITYVVMRYPASGSTGTSSAAPVVRDIMTVALPRYAISPSTTQSPDLPIRW